MRIATFNLRGGGSRGHWQHLLRTVRPDIAMVQETRDPSRYIDDLLDPLDVTSTFWIGASHGKWGSALSVRQGMLEPHPLSGPTWWAAGGIVRGDGPELLACSVHLAPIGGSYVRSAHAFLDALAAVGHRGEVVIGGDWNLTIGQRQPGETSKNSKAELTLIDRLRDEFALESAWSMTYPTSHLPQTLRWSADPVSPYHCDGILIPMAWKERVTHVGIGRNQDWRAYSDHNPVWVDLG